ncbi:MULTISPECIES: L-2-hydroxyglutarate oxidase [unclassified Cryobacterium]|uniref:L-2-hydroxyglutarate oxidase n=1 Tax=unclassified Cryobacterium TaxID=2649013 RepID=UPI00106C003D|nr:MULTISPECIES: L-2-hydroxyglutarate oxidase [unclassified Cryobacterium]TFC56708.1 L-2-hydroxyglutarate oxidase [Cryobacterium sp. TMB3-1-2]TFC72214.1 L-2-hydroxyglutarate oxidase [Cryobacterium sp. TMB3-15]TFC78837.1 L-2-hydroxyglutarate oxidase [Cryobacterium sp. TMB3-10]TFC85684.1 L-2-hydroxyglutarate oxidase [Cryobacterium sp. TMT4-31]TFD38630.1 L-2-hydroxyglutarate oxidase [Cryobacterium sp. TMB3-12]
MGDRIAIIGGGIVGVAIARALVLRGFGDVTVFEKEDRLAAHQTGRNSGVVHAGLYYQPGTLKARLCAAGRISIRDYCAEKNLPYREVGKLVVAVDESELAALADIERRSLANGVPDLARLDGLDRLREIEPSVAGIAAVHSPHTAAVDYGAITEAMAEDVRSHGGTILTGHEVVALHIEGQTVRVRTRDSEYLVDRVIACAGLQSDVVAHLVGADPSPKILPFRGEYWALAAARTDLVRGMIYPVPDPRFPFLGVHFTRGVYDDVHVGPNAVPALAREGYTWLTISPKDTWDSLRWPGAGTLAKQHWRMGLDEISGSLLKPLYYRKARRFIPELRMNDLTSKTAAGVRAQAWGRDGALLDDFAVDQVGPVTLLRNAPSPAATSSMAIADHLIEHYVFARTTD